MRKAGKESFLPSDAYTLTDAYSWDVIKLIQEFPQTIERAFSKFEPTYIAKHALHLSQAFNKLYANVRVLEEHEEKEARLALVFAVTEILKEDLRLLGVQAPDKM